MTSDTRPDPAEVLLEAFLGAPGLSHNALAGAIEVPPRRITEEATW